MSRGNSTALAEQIATTLPPIQARRLGFTRRIIDADISVGATLATARLTKERSIQSLATRLRLPVRYIEALESEDFRQLPGLIYEKHFVERYARVLGLDPEPLVKGWEELRRDTTTPLLQFAPRARWRDFWIGPFFWRSLTIAAVFLIVAGYLGSRFFVMIKPPVLTLSAPPIDLATTERAIAVSGTTEPGSEVMVNDQPINIKDDGAFNTLIMLEPGPNTIHVVASKRYGRPASVERQVFVATPSPTARSSDRTFLVTP